MNVFSAKHIGHISIADYSFKLQIRSVIMHDCILVAATERTHSNIGYTDTEINKFKTLRRSKRIFSDFCYAVRHRDILEIGAA